MNSNAWNIYFTYIIWAQVKLSNYSGNFSRRSQTSTCVGTRFSKSSIELKSSTSSTFILMLTCMNKLPKSWSVLLDLNHHLHLIHICSILEVSSVNSMMLFQESKRMYFTPKWLLSVYSNVYGNRVSQVCPHPCDRFSALPSSLFKSIYASKQPSKSHVCFHGCWRKSISAFLID